MTLAAGVHPVDASTPCPRAARWLDHLLPENASRRRRLYVTVAAGFYVLAWALALVQGIAKDRPVDFFQADARGFYAYLPALVINGNLDFSVATRMRTGDVIGGGILDATNERGYIQNQWPPGVAMTLLPAFLLAHGITWTLFQATGHPAFTPDGFTFIYQSLCLAWVMVIVTTGMICIDDLLQRRWQVNGRAIAAAIPAFWLGSHYAWYVFREPFMAHAVSSAWVIAVVCLFDRLLDDIDRRRLVAWRWGAIALCAALAIACRSTNVILCPFFAYLLWRIARTGMIRPFLRLLPVMLIGCLPLIIQLVIVRQITGQVAPTSVQGLGYRSHETFYWTDPALVQSLFSSRHGLFTWAPILLLSAWGLLRCLFHPQRRRDPLIVCFMLAGLMLWYINSAWYAWWFGWAFGNRGFLELAGLFIIGFAFCFERWPAWRRPGRVAVAGVAVLGVTLTYGLTLAKLTNAIPEEDYPLQWEKRFAQGAWKRF